MIMTADKMHFQCYTTWEILSCIMGGTVLSKVQNAVSTFYFKFHRKKAK